jgi:hypothetical protein
VVQDPAKPYISNISFTDVGVPVQMRSAPSLGIVGVHHRHVLRANSVTNATASLPATKA